MHPQTVSVTLGCLLHDVGKIVYRAGESGSHSASGYAWLRGLNLKLPGEVLDCVRWHHARELRDSCPPPGSLAYIACAADNISAAADRREEGEKARFDRTLALAPAFTHLNGEHTGRWLEAAPQDGTLRMPRQGEGRLDAGVYRDLLHRLSAALNGLQPGPEWVDSFLAVLESCTSTVPSSTFRGESPDISLFDHLKTTAAAGACISEYLLSTGESDYRGVLFQREKQFRQTPAFLLYSADFSGVQKFLYTVRAEGALRTLRSRSFFLEFAMEHYVDELLLACGVSRANLLYSGGGHCYLLLPNTPQVRQAADAWNTRFNEWLFDQFGTALFLAHGYTECTANDLTNTPAEQAPYQAMFRRVSARISRHKLHRVNAGQLRRLNAAAARDTGRECAICGRPDELVEGRDCCRWCALFEDLSRKIQTCRVYFVSNAPDAACDFVLPAADGQVRVQLTDEATARARLKAGEPARRVYTKNIPFIGLQYSTCLYVGDYAAANSMQELAQSAQGVQRLAVCRMDVDDLGQAFVAGFTRPGAQDPAQKNHYVTLSRAAAFSRQMSLFFRWYINGILSGEYKNCRELQLAIVYSGGDDVFLVGAWNDVLEGAVRIRQALEEFSCGALTISGGIGLFNDHFPIRTAALQTARLEDAAKSLPQKNVVALFGDGMENVYPWDVFSEDVLGKKLAALEEFFEAGESERGNALLYRMLALLRDARRDKLPIARYAYLLARLAPSRKARNYDKYEKFSRTMYSWALSPEDRRQLITAICIFVYRNRKGS